jgi:cation diffusion facilitator CzcD-associated flavoprotein CzcO
MTSPAPRRLSPRICVIGAGPSGLAAAKNLLQAGLPDVVVYEKSREVGGNWVFSPQPSHSSVFETTHIISSKTLSEYADYPWPPDAADYPGHRELLAYFRGYARRFSLGPYIRFGTQVTRAEPEGEGWRVTLATGEGERFDHLLVANGHHWDPRLPSYPGEREGRLIHSHDYKTSEPFRGERVLVIGGGNSACDIAVETGRISAFTAISLRRGYYFVPKFLFGIPSDVLHQRFAFLPRRLRARALKLLLRLLTGDWSRYGLPVPDHEFLSAHPVVNSELLHAIRHGRVHPRPDVERFCGREVRFVDGRVEAYDSVIAATGFRISFPFFDPSLVDYSSGRVPLYLRTFHPRFRNLFFIGLIQPIGCVWPLADLQSKLVANFIAGTYRLPSDMGSRVEEELGAIDRTFMRTPRHTIEVDYEPFRRALLREIPRDAPAWSRSTATAAASRADRVHAQEGKDSPERRS